MRFEAKLPGSRMQLAPVMMNFRYGSAFGTPVPEAYETLLLDAMLGDPTLFARHDFVEASWALITPIHEAWQASGATQHPDLRGGRVGSARGGRDDGGRRPPLEDAVSARSRRWRSGLLPGGHDVPFAEIEVTLARLVRDGRRRKRGPARALTATVIVVGKPDRLVAAAEALEQLGESGGVRAILISEGEHTSPVARVTENAIAISGLAPRYLNNAVAALRLSSLPAVVWWRGGSVEALDDLAEPRRSARARHRRAGRRCGRAPTRCSSAPR